MESKSTRLEYLIKEEGLKKLKNASVIIFGLGGVGSYIAEALCRSFIGEISIVDYDKISISNINRQLPATIDTIGEFKTTIVENRIKSINDECKINAFNKMLTVDNIEDFDLKRYDFVIDAIDSVPSKVALIRYCSMNKIKIISSMGMGNKIAPEKIKIDKLENTKSCALARKLKKELKDTKSAKKIKVVYSSETSIKHDNLKPGSTAFVPAAAGLLIASYVVRKILDIDIK